MRHVKYAINTQLLPYLIKKGFTQLNGLEFDYREIREPKGTQKPTPEDKTTSEPKKKSLSLNNQDSLTTLYFGAHGQNCDCGTNAPVRLTLSRKTDINAAIEQILSSETLTANPGLFNLYFNDYQKKINQVFPAGINDDLARRFKLNTAEFAAHKAYKATAEIHEATGAIEAKAIAGKYERFHKAEITSITARARSARQWQRFKEEQKNFPNLTWIRSRSATPRELHLGYVGITLPMDDKFWQNNQPGNLWNCKCDWKTTDAPVTNAPAEITKPARGLEGNPYTTGELITVKHPYYKDAPDWVKRNAMLLLPDELAFVETVLNGVNFKEHILVSKSEEATENRLIASLLSRNGYGNVELLPTINGGEVALRERYYGKAFNLIEPQKCPDCRVGNKLIEFKKSHGTDRSIRTRISEAAVKSDIVVLRLMGNVEKARLEDIIKGKKITYQGLKTVIVITHENKILTY